MATATATATATTSLPTTRIGTPIDIGRTSTPPPQPAKAIPEDFRSSLAAWWNNSSYKDARIAEDRLLRRMAIYQSPPVVVPPPKGWFGLGGSHHASQEQVHSPPVPTATSGLVATLRNVFIPTPNPALAPAHPADPLVETDAASAAAAPATAIDEKAKCRPHLNHRKKNGDDLTDYINTLEITAPENANSKEAVVVLHGYAAAIGFFFRNWESVARAGNSTGRRTFFLDWLGMGLSSRPNPQLLDSPSSAPVPSRVGRAEHFFLSSLESWRESVGAEKMILVGHSLGGYLASAYAVRYPHRVSGLILVSPAGIPHGPDYQRFAPSGERNQGSLDAAVDAADQELNNDPKKAPWQRNPQQASVTRRYMTKFFLWSWEKGVSPFTFLRNMGPWGPMFAGKYTQNRFRDQSEEDRRDIHSYIYNTSILKGSGEFCISHLLAPGAYARIPILDRIHNVKVPVTFLYGDKDWMDVDGGRLAVEALKKAGNDNASCHVVPQAGHHLYLDNPEVSNSLITKAIEDIPRPQ